MSGIVVGVDGSEGAATALAWAVREGHLRDLSVTAVLAWGLLDQHQAVMGIGFDHDYGRDDALTALRTYVGEAVSTDDAASVHLEPVEDLSVRALLTMAIGADLLVLGGRGLGGSAALMVGSVSSQCLHHARCPVALVPHGWAPPDPGHAQRLVVGTDGTPSSRLALAWALDEARARDAQIELVSAWQTPAGVGSPYIGLAIDPTPFEQDAHRVLAEALAASDLVDVRERPICTSVNGSAAGAVIERAKGADLIVLGSRGLGGVKSVLLGSVAQQVTHHAPCPVVVVPPAS